MLNLKSFITITTLILSICTLSYSQSKSILIGSEIAGQDRHSRDRIADTTAHWTYISLAPYAGYFINDYLVIGITGEYDYERFQKETVATYHGYGIFAKTILSIFPKKKNGWKRFNIAAEIAYLKTNNYLEGGQQFKKENQRLIKPSAGISYNPWKNLYIEIAYAPRFYLDQGFINDGRLNIEYHFKSFKK